MKQWDRIEAFVEVVKLGSFSAAGHQLGVSTSHISRSVSALEQSLGTQLLYRTTRQIRLTDAGSLYYEHCRQLFEGFREAESALSDLQSSPKGLLRLQASTNFGERYIAPLANGFLQLHPQLSLQMHFTNRAVDLIEEGFDVAIRMGVLKDSSLIARRLWDRRERIVGSPGYFNQAGVPEQLSDLGRHNCLIGSRDRWLFSVEGERREVRVSGRWQANSDIAMLDAALKGLGITQLPEYYVDEHLASGELVSVLDAFQFSDSAVWIVYPRLRFLPPKVRLFIDYLVEQIEHS